MKILYLTNNLKAKDGLSRYSVEVIKRVKKAKEIEKVEVIEEKNDNFRRALGLKKILLLLTYFLQQTINVRSKLKQVDIVHALDVFPFGLVAALAKLSLKNKRLFINAVGTDSVARLEKPLIGNLLNWCLQQAEFIFSISTYTKKRVLTKTPHLKNIKVIHLGVDFDKFYYPLSKKKFYFEDNRLPHLIGVGMLKRRKGFEVTLKSLKLVLTKFPLKYTLVGSQVISGYANYLKQLVKKLKLEKVVNFQANLTDNELKTAYSQADLFVLTPVNIGDHFEGFGLVYLEANAAGLPVIGTKETGAEEAIKDGFSGLLVEQNNPQATAQAIISLLTDQTKLKQLAGQAQKWAQRFSWEKTTAAYLQYYQGKL